MPALYQNNKDIPEDMLLGNLVFYNLTNMTVSESDLLDAFKNNNLPEKFVRKISHADAFRRATSSIKNEKVTYTDSKLDVFEGRVNVDEVTNDKLYIKRIVGIRILNDQKEEVSYIQLGSIIYDRANDNCSTYIEPNIPGAVSNINALFQTMETRYMTWATYHNHDTIRNTVLRIVESMHPIALMPTGMTKFIPKVSKDTLYGLKGLLNDLSDYSDDGKSENIIEILPLMDTQEQRNLVNKMYEEEIKESLYNYSQELTNILKKKATLSSRQAATYVERYNELISKVKDYESLLGTYTDNIHNQLATAIQRVEDNKES